MTKINEKGALVMKLSDLEDNESQSIVGESDILFEVGTEVKWITQTPSEYSLPFDRGVLV